MKNKRSFFNLTQNDLEDFIIKNNLKKYLVKQLLDWVYKKNIYDFYLMTNISKNIQILLDNNFYFMSFKTKKTLIDSNDSTIKFLFELQDGNLIETVLMKMNYGYTVCVTTQVGCNMGCKFCASGLLKKVRNLETSEIVLQIIMANQYLISNFSKNVSRIVVMGIGEPFDNFDNLLNFLKIATNNLMLSIGARHITVSTCGIVPKIKLWADLKIQVNLAISLHASNNEIRDKIMPINKVYNLEKLLDSIDYYLKINNRRITIEYILIENLNDSDNDAINLAKMFAHKLVYVNLIPYNPINELFFKRSNRVYAFYKKLRKKGICTTIRQEFGTNVNAACGQLRSKEIIKEKTSYEK